MSTIELSAASRVGNVRSNNEDMILAYDRFIRSDAYETTLAPESLDRFMVAVADGMGGHNAGEVASEMVLQNLKFYIKDLPKGLSSGAMEEAMNAWLQSIHQTVNARGRSNKTMSEMGTTLVGLLYYGNRYFWLNCGDSRLYRLRNGQLQQLTTDHSLVNADSEKRHSTTWCLTRLSVRCLSMVPQPINCARRPSMLAASTMSPSVFYALMLNS